MIKGGAVIGIGTILLVIGLGGLALLRTGVIYPPASIGPVNLADVKPPEPAQQGAQAPEPAAAAQTGQAPALADPGTQKSVRVPRVGKGERRYPGPELLEQLRTGGKESGGSEKRASAEHKSKSASYARGTHRAGGMRPVVIRFRFDPLRDREIYVARVHSGDKVKVSARRVGPAGGRVYVTYTSGIDSRNGALVKVGARHAPYMRAGFNPYERGYYVIEMKIYAGNRWNIKPRSFV